MNLELFIPAFIIFSLSWVGFLLIHKNIKHVVNSLIRILGQENKNLVKTPGLFLVRMFYFLSLLLITGAGLFLLMTY